MESGLLALSLSPDGELLTLLTGEGALIIMNREFDPLREVKLHQETFGEGEFVDVGWGKKETQFHVSILKARKKIILSR